MTNATGINRVDCRLAQLTWCYCKTKWDGGKACSLDILHLAAYKAAFENGWMTETQLQEAEYALNCLIAKPACNV